MWPWGKLLHMAGGELAFGETGDFPLPGTSDPRGKGEQNPAKHAQVHQLYHLYTPCEKNERSTELQKHEQNHHQLGFCLNTSTLLKYIPFGSLFCI